MLAVAVLVWGRNSLIFAMTMDYSGILNLILRRAMQLATFGGASPPAAIKLGNTPMYWVERVKYFGCYFRSRRLLVKWILLTQWESSIAHSIIF